MAPMKKPADLRHSIFKGTVSIAKLARRLRVSTKEIKRRMGAGRMAFVQIGDQLRIPREEFERLFTGR
jgi:excisionase family DNA binding protein